MENNYSDYKKALKAKYEHEKTGENANFLLEPTPAKLRDLMLYMFRENPHPNDLKTFELFMGFPFGSGSIQKINNKTDAFRPLISFLKNRSDLASQNAVEMLAILLQFTPRPYTLYRKKEVADKSFTAIDNLKDEIRTDGIVKETITGTVIKEIKELPESEIKHKRIAAVEEISTEKLVTEKEEISDNAEKTVTEDGEGLNDAVSNKEKKHAIDHGIENERQRKNDEKNVPKKPKMSGRQKTGLGMGLGILALGTSIFYNIKISTQKECMQWNNDRYIAVDCDEVQPKSIYDNRLPGPLPIDAATIEKFRKITVDSNTVFFNAKGDPLVWYCKNRSGKLEYFNQPGLHPETQETLRKITPHIISKYILRNN